MSNKSKRGITSIIVGIVVFLIGGFVVSTDTGMGLSCVAGAIAGGCYWIGSKE